MGFKRSEARMRQIETKLRDGMARKGITGEAAETIVRSITSFALYGFPESHAASFALLVYASAYLKAHYPAVFYAALLNNQPMGFYHPATLVKDAQRHGVGFRPIDVQASSWLCTVERDGAVRLGLCYVSGLREAVGRAIESQVSGDGRRGSSTWDPASAGFDRGQEPGNGVRCPKCGADDGSLIEMADEDGRGVARGFCNVCAHEWTAAAGHPSISPARRPEPGTQPSQAAGSPASARFRSLEHLVAATGARRDELVVLAEVGALNAFGYDRRSALWQVERAVRPAGELFDEARQELDPALSVPAASDVPGTGHPAPGRSHQEPGTRHRAPGSPLRPMSLVERVVADYAGTGLTIGPHPMALRRAELALRGVLRSVDLSKGRAGRRVRVAGAVITRQRPGTAKGMVFLTLEDETGVSNIIVQPDVFAAQKQAIVHEPYVLVEGVLQQQDGVTAVRAERVSPLTGHRDAPAIESHDFR
jgi:error-prone DNA polymerase